MSYYRKSLLCHNVKVRVYSTPRSAGNQLSFTYAITSMYFLASFEVLEEESRRLTVFALWQPDLALIGCCAARVELLRSGPLKSGVSHFDRDFNMALRSLDNEVFSHCSSFSM